MDKINPNNPFYSNQLPQRPAEPQNQRPHIQSFPTRNEAPNVPSQADVAGPSTYRPSYLHQSAHTLAPQSNNQLPNLSSALLDSVFEQDPSVPVPYQAEEAAPQSNNQQYQGWGSLLPEPNVSYPLYPAAPQNLRPHPASIVFSNALQLTTGAVPHHASQEKSIESRSQNLRGFAAVRGNQLQPPAAGRYAQPKRMRMGSQPAAALHDSQVASTSKQQHNAYPQLQQNGFTKAQIDKAASQPGGGNTLRALAKWTCRGFVPPQVLV